MQVLSSLTRGRPLERYGPLLVTINLSLLAISIFFWIDANAGARGFQEATWGAFAYSFPANSWAAIMMAGSALVAGGLVRPPSARLVAVGCVLQLIEFGGIAYSAVLTGGEMVVGIFASTLFVPMYMWILFEAVHHGGERSDN